MGTHIIGCAGLRPAAVIMPINTLIRSRIVEANNTTVTLLHTDNKKIQECYNICKKWLKKNFGSLQINNYTFDQNENFYSILLQDNEAIYFNVNGGMNWEVALLSLFLPDHTRCMYSDSNNLYTWNISEDIKTATPHKLQNIGLDSYNALSPLVSINEHNSLSKTLSNNVRGVLERIGINLAYSIEHKGIEKQILELIKSIQAETGMSVIFITHDLGVIASICDDVAVMYAGRIVEKADAVSLFSSPRHPYTCGLLESIPRFGIERKTRLVSIDGVVPGISEYPAACRFNNRCRRAFEPCAITNPAAVNAGSGHIVSCHLYGKQNG